MNNQEENLHTTEQSRGIWRTLMPTLVLAGSVTLVVIIVILGYKLVEPPPKLELKADRYVTQDTLPDGSGVYLNRKSNLSYVYYAEEKKRVVTLAGEGFFEIKPQLGQSFFLETSETLVQAISTAFNVKAYPDKDTIQVVVREGEVKFFSNSDTGVNVKPGETGYYSKRLHKFWKLDEADPNAFSYQSGVFTFNDVDLKSAVDKINEVFKSAVKLMNPGLGKCRITVTFKNESLGNMVDEIAKILKLTITRNTDTKEYFLEGPGC